MSPSLARLVVRDAGPPSIALALAQALLRPPNPSPEPSAWRRGDRLELVVRDGSSVLWLAAPSLGLVRVEVRDGLARLALARERPVLRVAVVTAASRHARTIRVQDADAPAHSGQGRS
ncbi:MAG: hypothetical protein IT457_11940 [Planctomycetes bacterium]|nr:hypothetical protein [Planctomycetota bacterium]